MTNLLFSRWSMGLRMGKRKTRDFGKTFVLLYLQGGWHIVKPKYQNKHIYKQTQLQTDLHLYLYTNRYSIDKQGQGGGRAQVAPSRACQTPHTHTHTHIYTPTYCIRQSVLSWLYDMIMYNIHWDYDTLQFIVIPIRNEC